MVVVFSTRRPVRTCSKQGGLSVLLRADKVQGGGVIVFDCATGLAAAGDLEAAEAAVKAAYKQGEGGGAGHQGLMGVVISI
jgi:hypothetical protein